MIPAAPAGRIATVVLSLSLAACAATPYAPYSTWNGGGFTETEVQPGLFLVRFVGNAQTTPDRTSDYALLRAADLCLARGKDYVLVGEIATRYALDVIDGTTTTTVVPSADSNAPPTVSTYTSPPTLAYSPSSGVAVACADQQATGAWDAHFLARSIRQKYQLG